MDVSKQSLIITSVIIAILSIVLAVTIITGDQNETKIDDSLLSQIWHGISLVSYFLMMVVFLFLLMEFTVGLVLFFAICVITESLTTSPTSHQTADKPIDSQTSSGGESQVEKRAQEIAGQRYSSAEIMGGPDQAWEQAREEQQQIEDMRNMNY